MLNKEVSLIKDAGLREKVAGWLAKAPGKFWKIAASGSGKYHAADECGAGGCVLHTRRVVAMVLMLAPAYRIEGKSLDYCIAAALLHDVMKQGDGDDPLVRCSYQEYQEHGPNVRKWFENRFGPGDNDSTAVLDLVETHMGIWGPSIPQCDTARLVHMADYVASRKPLAPAIPLE